jgi:threonyl-tRNA synthetase
MLIVGEKEKSDECVSIRQRSGDRKNGVAVAEFISLVREKIDSRDAE